MKAHVFNILAVLICALILCSTANSAGSEYYHLSLSQTDGFIRCESIPGEELEYQAQPGSNNSINLTLTWDGTDSAPELLDKSGLGGVYLIHNYLLKRKWTEYSYNMKIFDDSGRQIPMDHLMTEPLGAITIQILNLPLSTDVSEFAKTAVNWFTFQTKQNVASRDMIQAELIVQVGDNPPGGPGSTVSSLNIPFTNDQGDVGFTGALTDDYFVWIDDTIAWLNSSATTHTLTGAETTMGVGTQNRFIYSPAADGDDSVWTHDGLLLTEGAQSPGMAAGTVVTFNSRPTMDDHSNAFWIAGFNDAGGTSTLGRMCYGSSDYNPDNISILLKSDDIINGYPIERPSGIGFDYMVAGDNSHYIQEVYLNTGSSENDGTICINGQVLVQENSPSPLDGNYDNFDRMVINIHGSYAFSGDTDGDTNTDEFIIFNGTVVHQEGDTIAGIELVAGSTVRVLAVNSYNRLIHQWSVDGVDTLFYTCQPYNSSGDVYKLMQAGDTVDLDGDMIADATITDLNASGTASFGYWLADDGNLFASVDLDYGSGDVPAIIRLTLPECPVFCPNTGDVNLDGELTAGDAQLSFQIALGSYSPTFEEECAADCDGSTEVTAGDAQAIFLAVLSGGSCADPIIY